ncbi:hypothetical protein [Streptomyces sp. SID161]|uniref:hypothetical protein n=1 Tax=Streptomyces sp. SID161 TaxID=2690251 RepID=UPI00136F40E3|nr:hypothetical protein [Streptomyces sp. SID161]MYW49602.1 hypothetical protein [Streptomyces sp. SID161]
MTIRHHVDHERIARIAQTDDGWRLTWTHNRLRDTTHATSLEAVAAACDSYPEYLKVEDEEMREFREREEYEERFVRRRANAVARAVRVPTGGQKGWQERRPSNPDSEK